MFLVVEEGGIFWLSWAHVCLGLLRLFALASRLVLLEYVVPIESLAACIALIRLDGVVASKVVHHVALGAEALAAALRALERPVVVVDPHVHLQVVPVVERFAAG